MTIWVVVVLIVLAAVLVPAGLLAYTFRRAADATIEACDPADVPPSFGSSVAEFVQAGFLVAGALRITNRKLPDAYVVLLCNEALDTYGRLWVSQAGSSQFALTTPLLGPGLEGTLTSAREAPTTADPMELQQVFPARPLPSCWRAISTRSGSSGRRGSRWHPPTRPAPSSSSAHVGPATC